MSQNFIENQLNDFDKDINISSNYKDECIINEEYNNSDLNKPEEIEKKKDLNKVTNNESLYLKENENNEIIENQNNIKNTISIFDEEENNNILNNKYEEIDDENEEMNYNEDNINNIKIANYDNNNNDDEELTLITLDFISVCQCCKTSFDNNNYQPYLLKCGHFFCIKCINEYFTDKDGIKCPNDGLIAKSLDELTLLKNLIPKNNESNNRNNNSTSNDNINNGNKNSETSKNKSIINNNLSQNYNYCSLHKDQKLSHVICDTNEIICVYCAFECLKKNPKCEIKLLSSQLNDFILNINEIISFNQNQVLYLHDSLKKIKENKEKEEKSINTFFECLFEYLNEKKNDYFEKVNNIFNNNTKILGDKLEEVNLNIENSENLKKVIENVLEKGEIKENNFKEKYTDILNKYLMLKQKNKNNEQRLELDEYKFIHIDEDKLVRNFHDLGVVKVINKKYKNILNDEFGYNNKNNINLFSSNINNNNSNIKLNTIEKENNYLNKNNEIFVIPKEQSMHIKKNKSIEAIKSKNKIELNSHKKKNVNYIFLDDLSLNNNSYLEGGKNSLKFEINNDSYNNYYINENNNNDNNNKGYNIFNKKNSHNIFKKNTFNGNNLKQKKMIIHKNSKSIYNYIEFPINNSSLNNYNLLSKINNKKDKERNITVNNYEVHQTLKNSFNNNYNYGQNYSNTNYLNKLFEFNNTNFYTNKDNYSNRKKISFLEGAIKNDIKKFEFK